MVQVHVYNEAPSIFIIYCYLSEVTTICEDLLGKLHATSNRYANAQYTFAQLG